jgi:hypothetical protein
VAVSPVFDVFTLTEPISVMASGGDAMILNPYTMEVLRNDVVADETVWLDTGTQFMLVGVSEKTDTWLIIVSETGDFTSPEGTYGLVLRRKSFENLTDVAVVGSEGAMDMPADEMFSGKEWELNNDDDLYNMDYELGTNDHPRADIFNKHQQKRNF